MNNEFPKMLFKAGGPHEIHGNKFDTLIVNDETEQEAALAEGWHPTTPEALAATAKAPDEKSDGTDAPTREELEQKAKELGIEFSPNIGDKKLAERIEEKLKASA